MNCEIRNLNKTIASKKILSDVSLTIPSGQIIGLIGPNGAGKSSLLKCIMDLYIADMGSEILFDGQTMEPALFDRIAYMPEKTSLDLSLTPAQTFRFFETFYPGFDPARADELMEIMNLDPEQKIRTMSKGMQEKLQLVLLFARQADLYILDEPLGGVDPAAREQILDTILSIYRPESTLLISTHMIGEIERICDRAIALKDGQVLFDEDVELLREKSGQSLLQHYLEALL